MKMPKQRKYDVTGLDKILKCLSIENLQYDWFIDCSIFTTVFPRILEHATVYVTVNSEHAPLEKSKIAQYRGQTKLLYFVHSGMPQAVKPKNRIKMTCWVLKDLA